jgi:hypothetical protein
MGEISAMDDGFYSSAGRVVDAALPNVGDKAKVQINVNIPVDQSGTVRVAFQFMAECERDENGVKGRVQLDGGVQAAQELDAYFVTLKVFARATVFGYLESYGDTATQMFSLLGLGIQQRIDGVSSDVADSVFNRSYIDQTMRQMDSDDYVESGLGASVSVGGSASAGSGDDAASAGAGGGVTGSTGTRLSTDGRGGVRETDVDKLAVAINGSASPFGLEGKLVFKWADNTLTGFEAELSGEAMMDAGDLNEVIVGGRWLSGTIGSVANMIRGGQGMVDDQNAARQVGGLVSFIHSSSGVGVLAEGASAQAISQLSGMGVSLGHKLTVKGTWSASSGFGLEIDLERVGQIEFGDSPRDTVYVLVENVQRVFKIQVGS